MLITIIEAVLMFWKFYLPYTFVLSANFLFPHFVARTRISVLSFGIIFAVVLPLLCDFMLLF